MATKTKAAESKGTRKAVDLRVFNSKGVFSGYGQIEFESPFNRPRKTFMPDAVNALKDKVRSGEIGNITGIAQTLQDDPGSYVLVEERHGFPILLKAEDLKARE
jgi:hypothetical protein